MKLLIKVFFAISLAHTCHAQINITSLPYTCNQAGQAYVIANDLSSSSGNAITIQADNVKVNGNGKTLTFATSGAGVAISLGRSAANLEVFNLRIVQGSGGGSAFKNNNYAANGLSLHDLQIVSESKVGNAIALSNLPDTTGISITRNSISVNGTQNGNGDGIYIEGAGSKVTGAVSQNTITMGNKVYQGRSACIELTGVNGPLELWGNTLNMYHGSQGEGLQSWNSSDNIIRDNTVNMHCVDCRGLLIDGASDRNQVYGNKIYQNPSSGYQYGIRVRFASSYNEIFNNLIQAASANSAGPAIFLGESQSNTFPTGPPAFNRFLNNTLICGTECISIQQGSDSNYFGCNKLQTFDSEGIFLMPQDQVVRNLSFVNNTITVPAGFKKVVFDDYGPTPHPANPVVFCGGGILATQITGISGLDYVIQSTPCSENCGAPSAPKNLVIHK